jgi:hypothetical protein
MGKRKRDWAPLLEQADGRKRGPIGGRRDHRLPSLARLLEIDAAAEAEARQAIAAPPRRQLALFVVETTIDASGPARAADGQGPGGRPYAPRASGSSGEGSVEGLPIPAPNGLDI